MASGDVTLPTKKSANWRGLGSLAGTKASDFMGLVASWSVAGELAQGP